MPLLPRNPVTMCGRIDRCWLLSYRLPEAEARALLPRELEPVLFGGWAVWGVVVSHIQAMRPRGVPRALGISYWHAAHRLYARCHPVQGPPVEGLHFFRSDCDSPLLTLSGNLLTEFRFHTAPISAAESGSLVRLEVRSPDMPGWAEIDRAAEARLPEGSPFRDLEEAHRGLKYGAYGLSVPAPGRVNIVRIERDEAAWRTTPITVRAAEWAVLRGRAVFPEVSYEAAPIDYVWHRGVTVEVRS